MRKGLILILTLGILMSIFISSVSADSEPNVCCEKTISGLFCQNVPASQCQVDSRQVPTACVSTSYCKPGVCYDSEEGNCLDNTPQIVCNANNGTWSAENPKQCNLGCCILGDQAAFVSLVRCKRLSGFLGLKTNYRSDITNEVSCVLTVKNQDKGACVFEKDFQKTCKFTTRKDCLSTGGNGTNGNFFKDKLCTDPELGTICGKTTQTTCIPGKDEVYFVDSCGNPANIYDASKVNDLDYWTNLKTKAQSCNPTGSSANSASCGNCNYPQGSFCRKVGRDGAQPTYGDYMCQDLNCKTTQNGKSYKHGESWCVYNDKGTTGKGDDSAGSRFFKHICINGQEVLEQCADFRQEVCIEDKIQTSAGAFSQAACRVNRWQDCTAQTDQLDCENSDKRDCFWMKDIGFGGANSTEQTTTAVNGGVCLPKDTPGIKFWEGEEAKAICAQGNAACVVKFEKGLFGGEKCVGNCDCLSEKWTKDRTAICKALGDCGPKINWLGELGYKTGWNQTLKSAPKSSSGGGGGLFG